MFRKILLSLLLFVSPHLAHAAYTDIIGIPDPSDRWGAIDPLDDAVPARPSPWTTQEAGYYYVDFSTGDDTGNSNGYPGNPRLTIPDPSTIPAGSRIELTGTHSGEGGIDGLVCTEANPCWIVGETGSAPSMGGKWLFLNMEWVLMDNLYWGAGVSDDCAKFRNSGHHVIIRNSTCEDRPHPNAGSGQSGFSVGSPDNGVHMHDYIIYQNTFSDLGNLNVTSDQDFHGAVAKIGGRDLTSGVELSHVWFIDNALNNISGDSIQINGNDADAVPLLHHIYVGRNSCDTHRQTCGGVKEASDVIVSQNVATNMFSSGGNGGGCYAEQYPKEYVWFIFNTCYNSAYGYRGSAMQPKKNPDGTLISYRDYEYGVFVIGNLFVDIKEEPTPNTNRGDGFKTGQAIAWTNGPGRTLHAIDNTIYKAWACMGGGRSLDSLIVHGNICADITNWPSDHPNYRLDQQMSMGQVAFKTEGYPNYVMRENIYWDYNYYIDDIENIYTADFLDSDLKDELALTNFKALSPATCVNCLEEVNPATDIFVAPTTSPGTWDFSLVTGSGPIDANTKHPAYQVFEDRYGIDIYVDFEGNSRHATTPNMGAFESDTTSGGGNPTITISGVQPTYSWIDGQQVCETYPVTGVPVGGTLACNISGDTNLGLTFTNIGTSACEWCGTVQEASGGGGGSPTVTAYETDNSGVEQTTHSIALPSTVADNDLYRLFISANASVDMSTPPSGWTLINSTPNGGSHSSFEYYLFEDDTTAPTGGAAQFVLDGSVAAQVIVQHITDLSDPSVDTPLTATVNTLSAGGDTAPDPNSIAGLTSGSTYIVCTSIAVDRDETLSSYPTNYTLGQVYAGSSAGSPAVTAGSACDEVTGVTSEDVAAWTLSAANEWHAYATAFLVGGGGTTAASASSPFNSIVLTADHVEGGSTTAEPDVTVSETNTAPTAGTMADITVTVGEECTQTTPSGFSDSEGGAIYSLDEQVAPEWLEIASDTGTVSCTEAETEFSGELFLYYTDPQGLQVSTTFQLTATDPILVDETMTACPDISISAAPGEAVSVLCEIGGIDNDETLAIQRYPQLPGTGLSLFLNSDQEVEIAGAIPTTEGSGEAAFVTDQRYAIGTDTTIDKTLTLTGSNRYVIISADVGKGAVRACLPFRIAGVAGTQIFNEGVVGATLAINNCAFGFNENQLPASGGSYAIETNFSGSINVANIVITEWQNVEQDTPIASSDVVSNVPHSVGGTVDVTIAGYEGQAALSGFSAPYTNQQATAGTNADVLDSDLTSIDTWEESTNSTISGGVGYVNSLASASETFTHTVDYGVAGSVSQELATAWYIVLNDAGGSFAGEGTYQDYFVLEDSISETVTVQVSLEITSTPNDPPTCGPDTFYYYSSGGPQTSETALLANDSDINSDTLSVSLSPAIPLPIGSGTLVITDTNNGYITYTPPNATYAEQTQFSYSLQDGQDNTPCQVSVLPYDPPQLTNNGGVADVDIPLEEGITAVTTLTADRVQSFSKGSGDCQYFDLDNGSVDLNITTDFSSPVDANMDNEYSCTFTANGNGTDTMTINVIVLDPGDADPATNIISGGGSSLELDVPEAQTSIYRLVAENMTSISTCGGSVANDVSLSAPSTSGSPLVVSAAGADNRSTTTTKTIHPNLGMAMEPGGVHFLLINADASGDPTDLVSQGWTELTSGNANGLSHSSHLYYKEQTDYELPYPLTIVMDNTRPISYIAAYCAAGCVPPSTDAPEATTASGTSTSPNPPSVTHSAGAGTYLNLAFLAADGKKTVSAYPTNHTDLAGISFANSLQEVSTTTVAVAGRLVASDTEDPDVFALSASEEWHVYSVHIEYDPFTVPYSLITWDSTKNYESCSLTSGGCEEDLCLRAQGDGDPDIQVLKLTTVNALEVPSLASTSNAVVYEGRNYVEGVLTCPDETTAYPVLQDSVDVAELQILPVGSKHRIRLTNPIDAGETRELKFLCRSPLGDSSVQTMTITSYARGDVDCQELVRKSDGGRLSPVPNVCL